MFASAIASASPRVSHTRLRVTSPNAFASRWLVPRLLQWREAYPKIPLEIIGTDAVLDLRAGEAAVRQAQAGVDQAAVNVAYTVIRSPIDGIVGVAKSQVGDLVNGQVTMTTVSSVDPIKVFFNPSELEYMDWAQRRGPVDAVRSTPPPP